MRTSLLYGLIWNLGIVNWYMKWERSQDFIFLRRGTVGGGRGGYCAPVRSLQCIKNHRFERKTGRQSQKARLEEVHAFTSQALWEFGGRPDTLTRIANMPFAGASLTRSEEMLKSEAQKMQKWGRTQYDACHEFPCAAHSLHLLPTTASLHPSEEPSAGEDFLLSKKVVWMNGTIKYGSWIDRHFQMQGRGLNNSNCT